MAGRTCVFCGSESEAGYAELYASLATSLVFGGGARTLRFSSSTGTVVDLLKPAQRKMAAVCRRCGGAILTDEAWIP